MSQGVIFHDTVINDLASGLRHNPAMTMTATPWKYDKHQAMSRLESALLYQCGINLSEHGSMKKASTKIGVAANVLSNWRKRGVPVSECISIAQGLNVDVYYLLGMSDVVGRFLDTDAGQSETESAKFRDEILAKLSELSAQMAKLSDRVTDIEEPTSIRSTN